MGIIQNGGKFENFRLSKSLHVQFNFVGLWIPDVVLTVKCNKRKWQERSRISLNGTGKQIQGR